MAKVKPYLASTGFEILLLVWARAQIILLTQKTVFLLVFFHGISRGLFLLQFFLNYFFYFAHVSTTKPMVDTRHDLSTTVYELEAIE